VHQRIENSGRRARKRRDNEAPGFPPALHLELLALETTLLIGREAVGRRLRGRGIAGLTCVQCLSERTITKGKEYVNTWAVRCTSAGERVRRKDAIAGGTIKRRPLAVVSLAGSCASVKMSVTYLSKHVHKRSIPELKGVPFVGFP
jgi:hypothetical protein